MSIRALLLLPVFLVAACDGDSDDTDSDTDTELDTGYEASIGIRDFLSGLPIDGAEFDIEGVIATTDAEGDVLFSAPGGTFEVTATADGYLDSYWTFYNDDEPFSLGSFLVSDAAASAVAGGSGVALDPAKAVVVVTVFGGENVDYVSGATVTLDASSDLSLVGDSSAQLGFSGGNTTLADSPGWVVFLNVEAGSVEPTFEMANGESCVYFPGTQTSGPFTVYADGINHFSVVCE